MGGTQIFMIFMMNGGVEERKGSMKAWFSKLLQERAGKPGCNYLAQRFAKGFPLRGNGRNTDIHDFESGRFRNAKEA